MAKHKYISQDAAIDAVDVCNLHRGIIDALQAIISDIPAADVVEVVRCKDCRWWTKQEKSLQGRCELAGFYPTGEWFCANGERSNCGADMREVTPCSS